MSGLLARYRYRQWLISDPMFEPQSTVWSKSQTCSCKQLFLSSFEETKKSHGEFLMLVFYAAVWPFATSTVFVERTHNLFYAVKMWTLRVCVPTKDSHFQSWLKQFFLLLVSFIQLFIFTSAFNFFTAYWFQFAKTFLLICARAQDVGFGPVILKQALFISHHILHS